MIFYNARAIRQKARLAFGSVYFIDLLIMEVEKYVCRISEINFLHPAS